MNPDLLTLVGIARNHYPSAFISLITNGHGYFEDSHTSAGLDLIQFSIDGVCQQSYEKYRAGGDFKRASSYMRAFSTSPGSSGRTAWRYILFQHNDKPDQIASAWSIACAYHVSELRFIFTHKGMWPTNLTSNTELRKCLNEIGVPDKCIGWTLSII